MHTPFTLPSLSVVYSMYATESSVTRGGTDQSLGGLLCKKRSKLGTYNDSTIRN